ncbi:hypothetical protein [Clostridium sp. JS66]|uniref:hypothetical protein n=1 Tax=Clostridium sp. JS66 TaxID=3064705 RepID=UPI00298D8725|nr:hypothetical protein [Clostridium sp. JS66]WPC40938.1 hypothetical protein Q6H37_24065 [Clostridium sp. JS66]
MKNKTISMFIKLVADIIAILIVFSKSDIWVTNFLAIYGITDQKAILGVIVALGSCLSGMFVLLLEWLIFKILFYPINLEVNFLDNNFQILQLLKIKLPEDEIEKSKLMSEYLIQISISGGNFITNIILNYLGGDIAIIYSSRAYDTEILDGWLISSNNSLYKNKKGILHYYWTDSVEGLKKIEIEQAVIYRQKLIIKPKRLDIHHCSVTIKICSSERKNKLKRLGFFFLKWFLIKSNIQSFQIILGE